MKHLVMGAPAGGVTPPPGAALGQFSQLLLWSLFAAYVAFYLAGAKYVWLTAGAGYAVAVVAVLRIIWAFVGPRGGRLAEALRSPRRFIAKARQNLRCRTFPILFRLTTPGAMIPAIFGLLAYVSATGMLITDSPFSGSHVLLAAHDAGVYAVVGVAFLRLAWAVLESAAQGESLVRRTLGRGVLS